MVRARSSRRVPGLRPSDYDHEIGLVNHDEAELVQGQSSDEATRGASTSSQLASLTEPTEQEQGLRARERAGSTSAEPQPSSGDEPTLAEEQLQRDRSLPQEELQHEARLPHPALRPSIEVQGMLYVTLTVTQALLNAPHANCAAQHPRPTHSTKLVIV